MYIERDLLLGWLAIRAGYISLDQYDFACRVWASEKIRPLGEILQASGSIDAVARSTLEQAATRRLATEPAGTSPAMQATLQLPEGSELPATLVDPKLSRGSPAAMTLIAPSSERPRSGKADEASSRNPTGPRYTLVKIHGEGGLGRIWRARDNHLNREVAMKEMQPRLANSQAKIQRFLLEAQVTGQLEHPNIVPVYELGYRPQDGQPFYTMRFVRGKTLSD